MQKYCTKCGVYKKEEGFYSHPKTKDGLFHKCKKCVKEYARSQEKKIRNDPFLLEKERKRVRERDKRLRHKRKKQPEEKRKAYQIAYKHKYPEKQKARNKANREKPPKGYNFHHWSYCEEHALDTITLTKKEHSKAHRFMIYDQERKMYRKLDGELLDTKKRHLDYINYVLSNYDD